MTPDPALVSDAPAPTPTRTSDATPTRTQVVLDTSALVADSEGVFGAYPDADLIVPLTVIEELDGLKKRLDAVGGAARDVLRRIENVRVEAGGDLETRQQLPSGSTLRVALNGVQTSLLREHGLDADKPDNRIIGTALGQRYDGGPDVRLVSNDTSMRVKAATFGLDAHEHDPLDSARVGGDDLGWREFDVDALLVDALYGGEPDPPGADDVVAQLHVNEFGVLHAGSQSALVRRRRNRLEMLPAEHHAWDLRPRNKEQRFALDLLLDDDVKVVALDGPAGTGKTLTAVAAALQQVVEDRRYSRICVYRPVIPVGKAEVGYLPGTLDEKLDPWMAAITDAVYALTGSDPGTDRSRESASEVLDEIRARGQLTMESVTHLRGRTLHSSYVIIDESMNLSPQVGKTILTRIAADSKVVFTGDTSQIDAAFLSEQTNALTALVTAFTDQDCFGHVRLLRGERSPLSELAARLL
ncbi:MAG: PhoH family protein [Acidimicrobiales bacterium]|nr:PhoH family protein [Acidimicrobiales bacterium]